MDSVSEVDSTDDFQESALLSLLEMDDLFGTSPASPMSNPATHEEDSEYFANLGLEDLFGDLMDVEPLTVNEPFPLLPSTRSYSEHLQHCHGNRDKTEDMKNPSHLLLCIQHDHSYCGGTGNASPQKCTVLGAGDMVMDTSAEDGNTSDGGYDTMSSTSPKTVSSSNSSPKPSSSLSPSPPSSTLPSSTLPSSTLPSSLSPSPPSSTLPSSLSPSALPSSSLSPSTLPSSTIPPVFNGLQLGPNVDPVALIDSRIKQFMNSSQVHLSKEEIETLQAEGLPIPTTLPLTKTEQKALKTVRRKLRNKMAAQESRKKKKEYIQSLEDRVRQCTSKNLKLQKKVETLESENRSLATQLRRLQAAVTKSATVAAKDHKTQVGAVLMVFSLCFAILFGGWIPQKPVVSGNDYTTAAVRSRTLLSLDSTHQSTASQWLNYFLYGSQQHCSSVGSDQCQHKLERWSMQEQLEEPSAARRNTNGHYNTQTVVNIYTDPTPVALDRENTSTKTVTGTAAA